MTRINLIDPKDLTDSHLMAEYRELPMVAASLARSHGDKIPPVFTLNKGHVSFFYNKREFLIERMEKLVEELHNRGYQIDPDARNFKWENFDRIRQVKWTPSVSDKQVSVQRIMEKLKVQNHKWYGYPVDDEFVKRYERYIG
jgi:deoxyribonuclease (pyrimidine dimer)